nr:MAG TPA_asm: hypothetical protein [Caudoviricetes sp.]
MPCLKALTDREPSYFDLNENDYHLIEKLVAFVTISSVMIMILITGGGRAQKKGRSPCTPPPPSRREKIPFWRV